MQEEAAAKIDAQLRAALSSRHPHRDIDLHPTSGDRSGEALVVPALGVCAGNVGHGPITRQARRPIVRSTPTSPSPRYRAGSPGHRCRKPGARKVARLHAQQLLIGITGALLGVIGWLFVGMYLQRREHARHARDAGRAVYFELGANHLTVFTALEYGTFGTLSRATFDALLPQLATWLPAAELQALALAYLGHGAYQQVAEEGDLPLDARRTALSALTDTHRAAVELLRGRVFSPAEIASLTKYAGEQNARLMKTAEPFDPGPAMGPEGVHSP